MPGMILLVAAICLTIVAFIALYRAILGPTVYDRLVAVNVITTNTVLIILLVSKYIESFYYIDVSLVFVLSAFVGTLCVLKLVSRGNLN